MLLIDEIDRADDEFEAFLLEALSDFSITIPELGTFTAEVPPIVIITSNRTATCTTHSSGERYTTGLTIPTLSVRSPSFARRHRRFLNDSLAKRRWRPAWFGSSGCTSRPA